MADHLVTAGRQLIAALSVLWVALRKFATSRPTLRRVWHGVVGKQRRLSLIPVVSVPVTAVLGGSLVAMTVGYRQVELWVVGDTHSLGQWLGGALTGTGPQPIAIAGMVVLVAIAAVFAANNAGVVPSILLVMGPIFGIGLARYGMLIEHFSPSTFHRYFGITAMHFEIVGPVETLGTSLFLALLWGIPIGTMGFILGIFYRRGLGAVGRRGAGAIPSRS